jgi:hypothetical protein
MHSGMIIVCYSIDNLYRDWKNFAEKCETALEQLETFQLPLKWNNAPKLLNEISYLQRHCILPAVDPGWIIASTCQLHVQTFCL